MFNIIDLALGNLKLFAGARGNVVVQEKSNITRLPSDGDTLTIPKQPERKLSLMDCILQDVPILTTRIPYSSVKPLKQLFPLSISLNPSQFFGVEADNTPDGERRTLITNTPAFHQVNSAGIEMIQNTFSILGRTGLKFSDDSVFPSFRGNIEFNHELRNIYHHAQTEILGGNTTLGAFSNSRSQGIYLTLKHLIRHTTLMGKCGITHPRQGLEAQLDSDFELEDLHMTAGLDYSQLATAWNRIHFDTVLRHQDYLFGYAWVGTLVESAECSDMSHEHKWSFGWTDTDYAVNFTTSGNLSHHSFQLYQVINEKFDQTIAMSLNQNTNIINTEVALRWKMTPQDILTFKIDNSSQVGVAVEKKINEIVKITGAASLFTEEWALSCGFGVEFEL